MTTPYPPQPQPAVAAPTAPPKVYSAERKPGWEHIPIYPANFIILRIVQLFLAVIVLGLCAFTIHLFPTNGSCLSLFVAISTMITTVWLLVAEYYMPKIYNYWAVLALDIFLTVFWLIGMAVTASEANVLFAASSGYYDVYGTYRSGSAEGVLLAFLSCMAAAAAIGGVLFALFVTSLALHAIALHRHRAAGLHCNPGAARTPVAPGGGPAPNASAAEKGTVYAAANPQYQAAPGVQQPYAAPVQHGGYPQQQPQQYYNPAQSPGGVPVEQQQQQQGYYAPQAQYPGPQYQPQQQQVYPQQASSPAPLSAQLTGNSTQVSTHNGGAVSVPSNVQEVPAQNYHQQQQQHQQQ